MYVKHWFYFPLCAAIIWSQCKQGTWTVLAPIFWVNSEQILLEQDSRSVIIFLFYILCMTQHNAPHRAFNGMRFLRLSSIFLRDMITLLMLLVSPTYIDCRREVAVVLPRANLLRTCAIILYFYPLVAGQL